MTSLGKLTKIEGYTFAYSGMLNIENKRILVVAFETNPRTRGKSFEIKAVESDTEIAIVLKTMETKKEEPKPVPKASVWDSFNVPEVFKKKPSKTMSLFD